MAEGYKVLSNCKAAYREETTEGTAPSDSATGSEIVLRKDATWGFDREMVTLEMMRGHLTKPPPVTGQLTEVPLTLPVYGHGGASAPTPDYSLIQKHCWGGINAGTDGTVQAAPAPTTTGCTLDGGEDIEVGQLIRIPISGSYEYARVLTGAASAYTWWPPTSSAVANAATIGAGTAYFLKSAVADFSSGSAYFYNASGPARWIFSGLKGNATYNFEVGQPVMVDFEMQGTSYGTPDYTACGYTWADPGDPLPPVCLGISIDVFYRGDVAAGSTTEAVKVSPITGPGIEVGKTGLHYRGTEKRH